MQLNDKYASRDRMRETEGSTHWLYRVDAALEGRAGERAYFLWHLWTALHDHVAFHLNRGLHDSLCVLHAWLRFCRAPLRVSLS